MRRTSRTLPIVLAGSDFVFSGFGSIQRYDNMFGPSNFNAEDIDDFLAMQRDWGVDGGLRTVPAERIDALRRDAAQACRAVYRHLGLADFTDEHVERAVDAAGSKDLGETDTLAVVSAAHAIREGGPHRGGCGRRAGRDRLRGRGRADHGHDPCPAVRRLPADLGHLRREPAGAVPGHRPERLRRARAPATSRRRSGRRDRRHPAGPRGRRPAGASRPLRGAPAAGGGRPGAPGPGPARRGDRRVARGRPGRVALPVRADRPRRARPSCWPGWRKKAASAGWSGSTTPWTWAGSGWPRPGWPGRASASGCRARAPR